MAKLYIASVRSTDGAPKPLITVRAATDPAVLGGQYYGPRGAIGFSGPPVQIPLAEKATDPVLGRQLWECAEKLTGVHVDL